MTASTPVLVARDLRREYQSGTGRVPALRGVSLAVDAGTVVALVGPSGSGKTTLLNLLAGLDRPDDGEVHVAGRRIDALRGDAATDFRRRHIGFVFQFSNLLPTMTAGENVAVPLLAEGVPRQEIARRVADGLAAVGLAGHAARRATELSGGQMQRVALARALILDPPVVLADEPTGNLDSVTGETVLDLLCGQARTRNRAVLMVTHSYRATAWADTVLALQDGRMVPADDTLAGPHVRLHVVPDRETS